VSIARLREIEPSVAYQPLAIAGEGARPAPGMATKHYAPRARVVLASPESFARAIAEASAEVGREAVAAITTSVVARTAGAGSGLVVPLAPEAEDYARGLYAALHAVDEAGSAVVVIEDVPSDDPAWWAVVDRLARAASR
jgi:L-threonylcarbamoyladenylate synthase